jgi:choline dehydrogenase-like flavoprotein
MADMESNAYTPLEPEKETWDAVVIGTGMGGATAGYTLARLGRRVLFIEKGAFLHGHVRGVSREPGGAPPTQPEARRASGWWPYPLTGRTSFKEERFFAPLGCGSGGTTTLYAAQLERFRPEDFRPRCYHPAAADSTLPDTWPIEYADLVPYYERAERLYRVCGTPDPLDSASSGASLRSPPPLGQSDSDLFESFRELGLNPYRAHVGCEYIDGCSGCGGMLCVRDCKSDSARICLLPALRDFGAKLLADCEVVGLAADCNTVRYVRCLLDGREIMVRGRVIILAAGALMSPILLLNSRSPAWSDGLANHSGLVGKNLMVHAHVWVAITARQRRAADGPSKAISLNDFYVTDDAKLGTVQSLGMTVTPATIAYYLSNRIAYLPAPLRLVLNPAIRILAKILELPFRNATVFAGILEDLPYSDNRVVPDPSAENGMRFEYRYPEELAVRSRRFLTKLQSALRPRHRLLMVSGKNNLDYGHVCGTIRFGKDPKTSVLDSNNRAHGVANLYVVDASFLPSSGGTNLSLTLAANAIRVGEVIDRELGAESRREHNAAAART